MDAMNNLIEREMLAPMRANSWQNIPPVFQTACQQALQSKLWSQKAFVILLFAYSVSQFQQKFFEGESQGVRHLMLLRFELFFDSFLKGLRVKDGELVPFEPKSSRVERSFGWILWELRSYAMQL